jgi:hypothetical protein
MLRRRFENFVEKFRENREGSRANSPNYSEEAAEERRVIARHDMSWSESCSNLFMSTTEIAAEGLLLQATELAKSTQSLELMDCVAILHGYVELSKFDWDRYQKNIEDSVASLLATVDAANLQHLLSTQE